jgi:ABC-type phosphate transport system ATPase subunit
VLFVLDGEEVEFAPTKQFFQDPADARSRAYVEGGTV